MAYGVKEPLLLKVHQALHGYVDGHRQLALSVPLKTKDQKSLLALSDISGPGARLDEEGYLTGYPLQDSGYFALARTWPAHEMPRPGCVWTHTLLIDFNDLATLESLSCFKSAFKRPIHTGGFQEYLEPIRVGREPDVELSAAAIGWAKSVLTALYGKPKHRIVATRSVPDVDDVVLAIWAQQWPRLRRSFRFCTLAASDRSVESANFDLQVLSSVDRSVRSRFSDVIEAESIKPAADSWVLVALEDLIHPDKDGLRSFFRKLGLDVSGGRAVFRSLCRLYRATKAFSYNPEAINEAIVLLQGELGAKHARAARTVVAQAAVNSIDTLDDSSFNFLWSNLQLIEPDMLAASAANIGRAIWYRDPQRLVDLLSREAYSDNHISDQLFSGLETESLLAGLQKAPHLIEFVLAKRPDLIVEQGLWSGSKDEIRASMGVAKNLGLQSKATDGLLKSERSDLAYSAVELFGSETILNALTQNSKIRKQSLKAWIGAASKDGDVVADFLANHPGIPRPILHALAQVQSPDWVPNNYGADPWFIAWSNSTSSITEAENIFVMAYLLSRALGWRSRSQAELMQISFEEVHAALASDRLTYESWQPLDALLPWSIFWFSWDKCQRLRAGVANAFVTRELLPLCFARLTDDENLFYAISNSAAQSSRGRTYLKLVLGEMRTSERNFNNHILTIHSIID
ncbi:hypothetical protein N5E86_14645 [Stutzerimonas stutzeri]|uniref:GAP1-N1 domain-containing protein n=1 Tax=Stutzerimonas stutzeri TaxID=316 RepID=UPI002448D5CA|nr:hypothetical protein [Stutzerimonas stutzeri]MDH1555686.1 hypothetical protein [Stutzerimonas stutzeri]